MSMHDASWAVIEAVKKSESCRELPSSAEEGRAERSEAGVVLVNKLIRLASTTPALRATPPQLRRGAFGMIPNALPAAFLEVFRCGRAQCEVEHEPEYFRIPN